MPHADTECYRNRYKLYSRFKRCLICQEGKTKVSCLVCGKVKSTREFRHYYSTTKMSIPTDRHCLWCYGCGRLGKTERRRRSSAFREWHDALLVQYRKEHPERNRERLQNQRIECLNAYGHECKKCGSEQHLVFHHVHFNIPAFRDCHTCSQYVWMRKHNFPGADGDYSHEYAAMVLCRRCHKIEHNKHDRELANEKETKS